MLSSEFNLEITIDSDRQYFTKRELMKLFSISRYRLNKYLTEALDPDADIDYIRQQGSELYRGGNKSVRYYGPDIADALGVSAEKYKKLLKEYIEHELSQE